MKTKLPILIISALAIVAFCNLPVSAAAPKLTAEKSAKISQNCGVIRQKLESLQRVDSRTYSYFHNIYDTVATKYIKPLNLRLVDNNTSNSELLKIQTSIKTSEQDFSDDFIEYNKTLDELEVIDCKVDPEGFYTKLVDLREKRAILAKDIEALNNLLVSTVKNAEALKGKL